ncbi:hypothetical protein [uncultured virus]|uniref:Glutaredoxin domain-containing protein n=1 Tax=uncultured virus TaxID=340016 RepID=A0A218MMT5_9VIRU|nr:hypothetical protein [uncultured virus]
MAEKTKLKSQFIGELKDHKEQERLKRVKANSSLKEVVIYTDKNQPQTKNYLNNLEQEGIKFKNYEVSENMDEWKKVISITNFNRLPAVIINKNILHFQRDFQQPQQLIGAIQHFASPNFINPDFERHMLEALKTNNYNLFTKFRQIEQRLMPLTQFITTLQKQIAEEEKAENEQKNN